MTKCNARRIETLEKRDTARYDSHIAIEAARNALSDERYLPTASNLSTQSAPRDNATDDTALGVEKVPFSPFRVVWGDFVTLLSLGICMWFLLKVAGQLLLR